jgi:hypothetical protein
MATSPNARRTDRTGPSQEGGPTMNVTTIGAPPAPPPAPLLVQRTAASTPSADTGARETPQQRAERRKAEPPAPKLPPLEPVSTKEFRVMLGALPASALHETNPGAAGRLDVYA